MFLKELIYFNEIYFFEASRPLGSKKILFAYYNQVLERIRMFFDRHQVLYTYYRSGKTEYDEVFFLREASTIPIMPGYSLDMDSRFCTIESFKLSKLQAYEMLYEYLQSSIAELDQVKSPKELELSGEPVKNIWTDPKATLIELAYAIQARGSVDYGKADVKQIVEALQMAFHIDLGNYYGVFTQNIRLRKKNRTVYLDQLIEYLRRRMDDLDE